MSYSNMNMKFSNVVGAKVRCLRDDFQGPSNGPPEEIPKAGKDYTIRQAIKMFGDDYYRFEEIKNPEWDTEIGPFEPAYSAQKFEFVEANAND